MGKTSERLEAYQTQMSIYAEQHKIILASDVLDMIEQLQEDLKDDIEKVVAELEEMQVKAEKDMQLSDNVGEANAYGGMMLAYGLAIPIVEKGGVDE